MCNCDAFIYLFFFATLVTCSVQECSGNVGRYLPPCAFYHGLRGVTFLWHLGHPSFRVSSRKGLVFKVE